MLSIKPFLLLLFLSVVVVYFTFIFKLTLTKSSQNFSQILILRVKSLKWNSFKINPLPVHTAGLTSTTTGCPQPGSSPGHSQMWHQILLWTILFVTPPCVCPLFRVPRHSFCCFLPYTQPKHWVNPPRSEMWKQKWDNRRLTPCCGR